MRIILCLCILVGLLSRSQGEDASTLRLVPFPKDAKLEPGAFSLSRRLILEISQAQAQILGEQITAELKLAGYSAPTIRPLKTAFCVLRLSTKPHLAIKRLTLRPDATPEDYALQVLPNAVTLSASGPAGLFYGAQTLRQLIRANRQNDNLPVLAIADWPSLRWRGFQDDLTRGPSSTLQNLVEQAELGAFFKLNVFTYYMESQFAFQKHPVIGPKNGSLTADELKALVTYSQPLQLNILGNQQSFGHFTSILAHPEYAALRETPYLLCPTNSRTYQLLDDLYSEVAPLLPFPYFNVCCDEADGLGEGPSKALVHKIGPGALYVQHICRVYDLIKKYNKRMMMWGDMILKHPELFSRVPKDTVMLTWAYDSRLNFDDQIDPFVKAGHEFFVCPGVNNWNRILPDFGTATTNIQNFVRAGVKAGASGMLNTAWDDDGETFNAPNWHGFAWGAECAWTGSTTSIRDFNRRVGPVLFGESTDSFGQAVDALSIPGIDGMPNTAFWQFSFGPLKIRTPEAARAQWESSLKPVRTAITNLVACRKEATAHSDLLDYYLFGAHRMELCLERECHRLQAALEYRSARRLSLTQALPVLEQIEAQLRSDRDAHAALCHRFAELWYRENKPYGLDWTTKRFRELIRKYDAELERLAQARANSKPDRSLPTPREVGLELVEEGR